jgi:NitT/TauT family transport system substrate-binding protein
MKHDTLRSIVVCSLALAVCACNAQPQRPAEPRLTIRQSFSSEMELGHVPGLLAHELLESQGYKVETTFFSQTELAIQSLVQGEVDFCSASSRSFWLASAKGADIATIMESKGNEWQLYSVRSIETCRDLQGRRLAQHSESAIGKTMTDIWIEENCPRTEPEVLIIPGSSNRAAALLAGQIDATPVAIADWIYLEDQAPGRFHSLVSFARDLPKLSTIVMNVNGKFAREHPQAVVDYLKALLTVHRQIRRDPQAFVEAATRLVDADPELAARVVEAYVDLGIYDVNGGLGVEDVAYSLNFFVSAGELESGLTVSDVADLSFLESALADMGRE